MVVLIPIESEWIYCENLLLNVIAHLSLFSFLFNRFTSKGRTYVWQS